MLAEKPAPANTTSPWIGQFAGQSQETVKPAEWKVKKDGGVFDAHTGATISARAVTNASGRALSWALARREKLFALPVDGKFEEAQP